MSREALKRWLAAWMREQKYATERIRFKLWYALQFIPMSIVDAIVSLCIAILIAPLVFANGLTCWIIEALDLQRRIHFLDEGIDMDYPKQLFDEIKDKKHLEQLNKFTKYKNLHDEFASKFVSVSIPFILGVLSTLIILFFTGQNKK